MSLAKSGPQFPFSFPAHIQVTKKIFVHMVIDYIISVQADTLITEDVVWWLTQ